MEGTSESTRAQKRLIVNGVASLGLTAAGYASAWVGYQGYPPNLNRLIWGSFSLALFGYWVAILIVATFRLKRRQAPGLPLTRKILEWGTFLGVNGVTWLFMPFGSPHLQLATLLFSTSYCAATILSSADEDAFTRWRIAIVMGSLAIVCVLERVPFWPLLTIYLVMLSAVLMTFDLLVRRSIAELAAARLDAEAARDARTRFLVAATHDLGQPLQAARLFHEQSLRAPGREERQKAAVSARAAFESMELLLHAMLDYLRLAEGKISPSIDTLDVGKIFAGLVDQYSASAELQNVSLIAMPVRQTLSSDRRLCDRILGNFIDNALRHSRAKRIRLGARTLSNGRRRLFVVDDGIGIGAEDVSQLFDDFVQGAVSGEGGFGLGLASARRAAAAIGGTVGHDPRWRNGSLFYLELPQAT